MLLGDFQPRSLREILTRDCRPSEECIRAVEKACELRKYRPEEVAFPQGEVWNSITICRCGLMRVSSVNDGQEDTVLFGTAGDVFTSMHSLYNGEPSVFSLSALAKSELWILPFAEFHRLAAEFPELHVWMYNLMKQQLYGLEKRYLFFSCRRADERFRLFMMRNTGSLRTSTLKYIASLVPLKYIAQYLKVTPSTLSRLRRKHFGND